LSQSSCFTTLWVAMRSSPLSPFGELKQVLAVEARSACAATSIERSVARADRHT
jgi:hypothetical protein